MTTLDQSIHECLRIASRSGSSFRFAFGVLPGKQRAAMNVLYAFFRLSDDLGDDANLGTAEVRLGKLRQWRSDLDAALVGLHSHPIHEAVQWCMETYKIPPRYLHDVLDGCESDLAGQSIRTFADLKEYCYRVASAVGLACIRVWGLKPGYTWEEAEPLAIEAGYAFQITNILRDLGRDAADGRVYLPAEEIEAFDVHPQTWNETANRRRVEALLSFQVERARGFYRSSAALSGMLTPRGRAIHELMRKAYSGLLEKIARKGFGVLTCRVRLGRWQKFMLLAGVVQAKLGKV